MNLIEFKQKASLIHNNYYDYSKVLFDKMSDKIKIICPKHGEFEQKVCVHINDKCGCKVCGLEKRKNPIKKNKEKFIQLSKEIHGEKYDYSLVEYVNSQTKVKIICKKHGVFEIKPYAHIGKQKQGCCKCGIEKRNIPHKKTTKEFIEKAKEKWSDRYDYSITEYKGKEHKIKYICREHGEQNQFPKLHIKSGCQFCNGRGISKYNLETFIETAQKNYGNKFDYNDAQYINSHTKIKINCPKHGQFEQKPYIHLNLIYGCRKCSEELYKSKAEEEITNYIKSIYKGKIENNTKKLNGKEIDIYLPELKFGIEYHGLYWHTYTIVGKNYHKYKADLAEKLGIKLIQIYDYEYLNKKNIFESKIKYALGLCEKVYARKTSLIKLNNQEKNNFLKENHLQGTDSSSIFYGLKYNDEIVSCMTFGKPRFTKKYDFELYRFASKRNLNVIGAASKLLVHFKRDYKGSIISYANRRWSNGNLYYKLGFELDKITSPGYIYFNINKKTVHNRLQFKKNELKNMIGYEEKKSEYEIMLLNGYDRIYDAGTYTFYIK